MTLPQCDAEHAARRRFSLRRLLVLLASWLACAALVAPARGQAFPLQLGPGQPRQQPAPSSTLPAPADRAAAQAAADDGDEGETEAALPTKEALQQRIEQLPATPEGESPIEEKQLLQEALAQAEARDAAIERQAKLQGDLETRPQNTRDYQRALEQAPPAKGVPGGVTLSTAPLEEFEGKSVPEIMQEVEKLEQALKLESERLAMFQARPKQRTARLAEIPTKIAEARKRIQEIEDELAAASTLSPEVAEARRLKLRYEREALLEKIDELTVEEQVISTGEELNTLQQRVTSRNVEFFRQRHDKLQALANRKRQAEAGARVAEARRQAQAGETGRERPSGVKALADRNVAYAEKNQELAQEISTLQADISEVDAETLQIDGDYTTSKERIEPAGGLSQASGQMLRHQLLSLPDTGGLRRRMGRLTTMQQAAMFEQFENIDRHMDLLELDDDVAEVLGDLDTPQPAEWREEVRALLETQRENLAKLKETYDQYLANLSGLSSKIGSLITLTENFNDYITERVLWIRSADTLLAYNTASGEFLDLNYGARALRWTFNPNHWMAALRAAADSFKSSPLRIGLLAGLFALVLGAQDRMRKRLRESGEAAAKKTCAEMRPTLDALVRTAVIAVPWPLLVWTLGWMMDAGAGESEFVRSLGVGLRATACCYLFIEVVRHICRRGGLAEMHFEWSEATLRQVRSYSGLLGVTVLPLILWTAGLDAQNHVAEFSTSLGRVAFMAAMLIISLVLYRVLMMSGSPFRRLLAQGEQSSRIEMHKVWRPLLVAGPAALAVAAGAGYYYTAQWLAVQGFKTAALVVGLLIIGGLIRRWLLVNRRRLAREQARQRRAQLAALAEAEGGPPPGELVEETVDFAALSQQTEKLMRTLLIVVGLIGVSRMWYDLWSAIAFLGEKPVWDGVITQTWSQIIAFALASVITYVCVRDVPALLELIVLQRLPLDSGARYAISTMCRYVLLAVGGVIALSALRLDLSQLGWLVAAMGVGLGFGLQEIVANFVSGIILLFERPIRVGDIITLGDTTGVVTRIRIRATAITDWDRKEYIVPNKDVVTGRLLNWTLTDLTNRVVVNVGVAYGSDTQRACAILLEVCRDHPIVLEDPEPIATFEAFGDSTLNLVLRCYLPNLEHRLQVIHELHTEIDKRFKADGLEIAFPQLDLHVRSAPEFVYSDGGSHAGNGARRVTVQEQPSGSP